MIYLDNNATTFLIPAVRARIEELMAAPIGNPSSPYRLGAEARAALEQARDRVAEALGTRVPIVSCSWRVGQRPTPWPSPWLRAASSGATRSS